MTCARPKASRPRRAANCNAVARPSSTTYIGSAMCTPSRGVMFSGQPPQVNGVFDQMETGYVPSLRTDRPSMGTIFRQLGYRTAYFGKFELRRDIIVPKSDVNYSDALAAYGFESFEPDGDKVGAPDQGYDTDIYTAGEAVRWLRKHGQTLNRQGIPWLLVVSFISPHDIMYADVNQPGQMVQKSQTGGRITRPPANAAFATRWKFHHALALEKGYDLDHRGDITSAARSIATDRGHAGDFETERRAITRVRTAKCKKIERSRLSN